MSYKPSVKMQRTIEAIIVDIYKTKGEEASWRRFWACLGVMVGEAEANVLKALMPKPLAEGEEMATVEGSELYGSLADHEQACLTSLANAQKQQSTDIPLIATLCNSVKLAREYQQWQMKPVPEGEAKIKLVQSKEELPGEDEESQDCEGSSDGGD